MPELFVTNTAADPMVPRPYRIRRVRRETHDTFTFDLVAVDERTRLCFRPGQFNMLYVFGVGEVPISISGDPAAPQTITQTTRVVGNVTKAMWRMKRGDTIGIRGPFGSHWPVGEAVGKDIVLIAGGIGLAPLRSVVYELLSQRERFGRISLLYGARTPADILYARELERWRGKFDLDVQITVDRADGGWRGNVGVVTTLIPRSLFAVANTLAMMCGPEVMMRYAVRDLQGRGVSSERIYISMERNMKCAVGFCGHCQYGPLFICRDGPVVRLDRVQPLFSKAEI